MGYLLCFNRISIIIYAFAMLVTILHSFNYPIHLL